MSAFLPLPSVRLKGLRKVQTDEGKGRGVWEERKKVKIAGGKRDAMIAKKTDDREVNVMITEWIKRERNIRIIKTWR